MFENKELYSIQEIVGLFPNSPSTIRNRDVKIYGISTDTRSVQQDSIFIALSGDKYNGHDFIETAMKRRVALIICEYVPEYIQRRREINYNNFIIVKNSLEALTLIAKYNRNRLSGKVVAITGNIGKTTTKEIISSILSRFYKVHNSIKSFNNHIGVPITLANAPIDSDLIIMELGMNQKGEISYLTNIVRPNIAIITTIAPVHCEFFNNMEEIAMAKAEIFEGMNEDGIVILNEQNQYYPILENEAKKYGIRNIVKIGLVESSHIYISDYKFNKSFQTEYEVVVKSKSGEDKYHATVNGVSYHSAFNTLFIFALARLFKLDLNLIAELIEGIKTFEGRGNIERVKVLDQDIIVINDSYNSSPEALSTAINSLAVLKNQNPGSQSIAVLGDMLELGEESEKYHMALRQKILDTKIDKLITIGHFTGLLSESLKDNIEVHHFSETRLLVPKIRKLLLSKDNNSLKVVLFKASNSFKIQVVLNKLYR